jgi:hypothetical protein
MAHGGWAYDHYPELETVDAGKRITVADVHGRGAITSFHSTRHGIYAPDMCTLKSPTYDAREVVLEIYDNGSQTPRPCAPIGDFHGDGHAGLADAADQMDEILSERAQ